MLGALFAVLAVALVPLSLAARQNPLVNGGEALGTIPFAAVGVFIARRQPRNPIGWLFFGIAACLLLSIDSGFYSVISYRLGQHLPLAPVALFLYELWGPGLLLFALVILLFPDGRLPSRSSRWALWLFLAVLALFTAALIAAVAQAVGGHHVRLDAYDGLVAIDSPAGWFAVGQAVFGLVGLPFIVWCVVRQVVGVAASIRRAAPAAQVAGQRGHGRGGRPGDRAAGARRCPASGTSGGQRRRVRHHRAARLHRGGDPEVPAVRDRPDHLAAPWPTRS